MLNVELIAQGLPSLPFPADAPLAVHTHIYLYRSHQMRGDLHPMDCWLPEHQRPSRDFELLHHITPEKQCYTFHVHRPSLSLPFPLWYQVVVITFDLNSHRDITFLVWGGGGRGPSDDAQNLLYLFEDLRNFPSGWYQFVWEEGQEVAEPTLCP